MGKDSKIEWTHHTFNPWWGCSKVSLGCRNCYAERDSTRHGHDVFGSDKPRRFFGSGHWRNPVRWNQLAMGRGVVERVFCASMCDILEKRSGDVGEQMDIARERLWKLIESTQSLNWLLLTKRPYMSGMFPLVWFTDGFPSNVWMGTSTEDQVTASRRIPWLIGMPARIRFLSAEPLLGPIDFQDRCYGDLLKNIHWVIVGGESGVNGRWMDPDWARSIRDQCQEAGVAFFMKQMTGKKEIPSDLLIREFPDEGKSSA